MRFPPTLLTAAVLVATSCTGDPTSTGTSAATTARAGTEAPNDTSDRAAQCVHTDPAKQPISVHRALSCPDGTSVSVTGIVTRSADGTTMLCDAVPGDDCLKIDGGDAVAGPNGGTVWYTGIVAKGVLNAGRSAPVVSP